MKRIIYLGISVAIAALSACGGGGGGSTAVAPAGIVYTGAVTPATITGANANALTGNVSGNTNTVTSFAAGAVVGGNGRSNVTAHLPQLARLTRNLAGQAHATGGLAVGAIVSVNATIAGPMGGTATATGQIDDVAGTGSITVVFAAYKDIDNTTISGSLTMAVSAYDVATATITDASLTFSNMIVTDAVGSITFSGSMREQITIATKRDVLTANFVAQDNATGDQVQLQNFVFDSTLDNLATPTTESMLMNGRVFDSVEGYVDIATTTPLVIVNLATDAFPTSGGPMVFTGSAGALGGATMVRVTPQSATMVLVEADTTGNGTYDYSSGAILWSSL